MILIADSGSTKCDWALLFPDGKIIDFHTIGFNPLYHSASDIIKKLQQSAEIKTYGSEVKEIFYYGAGSGSSELKLILKNALEQVFPNASVNSYSDLEAAAKAANEDGTSISCIIGTGSNSCLYDGHELTENSLALGYILGDEASGAFFGKKLLAAFLNKILPQDLMESFYKEYEIGKKEVVERVYRQPHANVYLASFMPFIHKHKTNPFVQNMLSKGFRRFLLIHVLCYSEARSVQVHFVGSVAHFFEEELRQEAKKLNISVGKIIPRPIEGLKQFHRK